VLDERVADGIGHADSIRTTGRRFTARQHARGMTNGPWRYRSHRSDHELTERGTCVFDESKLPEVVRVLERREASLWHACQLLELAAWLRVGGITSGTTLARAEGPVPDRTDAHGRVRFHLDDIGHGFAGGWATMPDLFGPITLQLAPAALADATDATVTLRSSAASGDEPGSGSLSDPRTVDELFWHEWQIGFPRSTWMRFGDHLQGNFGARDASTVDVLVTPRHATIGLQHVVAVWVDPLEINGVQLIDVVSGLCDELGVPLRIRRRTMVDPRRAEVWRDIGRLLCKGPLPLLRLVKRADASDAFRAWAAEMRAAGRAEAWERFARRLYDGTLRPLAAAASAGEPNGDGFWSRSRRQPPLVDERPQSRKRTATLTRAEPLRACGHPVREWDAGLCYACLGRARSAWRYEQ
jgi:hypothetical protein